MLYHIPDTIGRWTIRVLNAFGGFILFIVQALRVLCTTRLKVHKTIEQMQIIGVHSFVITFLTGSFTGLALALQSYIGFNRVGADEFIGLVVALGMTRELGPVLTGLMVTGRAGSAMAAEIGTMKITEQIDALRTVQLNPYQYLIVPRLIGGTIILPFLTLFSMICGIGGGYIFCVHVLGLNHETYVSIIQERVKLSDITGGLIKAASFGFILSWVGTYYGYQTSGGSRGVGLSTTRSVVIGSIMILIANYFLSSLLFQTGIS